MGMAQTQHPWTQLSFVSLRDFIGLIGGRQAGARMVQTHQDSLPGSAELCFIVLISSQPIKGERPLARVGTWVLFEDQPTSIHPYE